MSLPRLLPTLAAVACLPVAAQTAADWQAGLALGAGDGSLAPHYIAAQRGGTVTQQHSTLLNAALWHDTDTTRRVSWGAGVELWGGWSSSAAYATIEQGDGAVALTASHDLHPARSWVQQAWAQGKHRAVLLTVGAKHAGSPLLTDDLTGGDLTRSGNARPMPGVSGGFVDFQSVPGTRRWLQVNGEVGYYKPGDDGWLEHHYNYYNNFITTGWWLNYKNIYLRSHPDKPLVATLGMQAACQFGGTNTAYTAGVATATARQKANAEAFFKALIPGSGGSGGGDAAYYEGNHLGSWDVLLDYRLRSGAHIRMYYQSPWEDGSGIGKKNGFDGLWGVEWRAADAYAPVAGAVVEYLDLTNQSGPIHWAPADHPGTTATGEATGMDNYYNNYNYSGYQNRGLAIGTPMLPGALYNRDGYLGFLHNRVRGVHAAVKGRISPRLAYRLMASHRTSWGTYEHPVDPVHTASLMLEGTYTPAGVPGLECRAQFALDRGCLLGDNTGALLTVTYHGNFTIGKR